MSTSENRPAYEQQTVRALAARAAFWGSNEGLMREIEQHPEWDGVLATAIRIAEGLDVERWAGLVACGWVEDDDASRAWYAAVELEQPAPEPAAGSDCSPCVDCNPIDEPPAELRPLVDAFAAAWDARAESLARVARALAPEPLVEQLPAGCRVRVTFGPDAGQVGTVVSGPSPDGYYSVKVDGREPDGWGSLWFFLRHEITHTTVPPAEDRPWANDAAYAAEGQRIG